MKNHFNHLATSRGLALFVLAAMSSLLFAGCGSLSPGKIHDASADKDARALEFGYAPGVLSPGYGPIEMEGPFARKGK